MSTPESTEDKRWVGIVAIAAVGCAVIGLSFLIPDDGLRVGAQTLRIAMPPSWQAILHPGATPVAPEMGAEDVAALLAEYDAEWSAASEGGGMTDSTAALLGEETPEEPAATDSLAFGHLDGTADSVSSVPERRPVRKPLDLTLPDPATLPARLKMEIPESAREQFGRLFEQLNETGEVDVLHYGDSQIEGDRISGVMRNAWQDRWGGYGPGLQAAVPLVQSFALKQDRQGDWKRHTRYGSRDTSDTDERYGLMACYADLQTNSSEACLSLAPERRNHSRFGKWDGVRIWHDSIPENCAVFFNGEWRDSLRAGSGPGVLTLRNAANTGGGSTGNSSADPWSRICFGGIPPRIFALEPLGRGVQWHGIPMRGSSGTLFRRLDRSLLVSQWKELAPDLVILQYGGNSVPYCADTAAADRYGRWFSSQIRLFRSTLPETAILVIGPSDMAEKSGVYWSSYPMLGAVRDALRQAAMDEGAAFWDLLEVMGGLGSMPGWVESEPPLAGPDHVHFTPRGAKHIGKLLDRSFLASMGEWQRNWALPSPETLSTRPAAPVIPSVPTGADSIAVPQLKQ